MRHHLAHAAFGALVQVVSIGARGDGVRLVLAEVARLDVTEPVQRSDGLRVGRLYLGLRRKRIRIPYRRLSSSCTV